jgi:hypothetical protein
MSQSGLGSFGFVEPPQQLSLPAAATRNQMLGAALGIVLRLDQSPPVSVQLESPGPKRPFTDAEDILLAWIIGTKVKRVSWLAVTRTWEKFGRYIKHSDPSVAIWARTNKGLKDRWSNSRAKRKSQ